MGAETGYKTVNFVKKYLPSVLKSAMAVPLTRFIIFHLWPLVLLFSGSAGLDSMREVLLVPMDWQPML